MNEIKNYDEIFEKISFYGAMRDIHCIYGCMREITRTINRELYLADNVTPIETQISQSVGMLELIESLFDEAFEHLERARKTIDAYYEFIESRY